MCITDSTPTISVEVLSATDLTRNLANHCEEELQKVMTFSSPFNMGGENDSFVIPTACQDLLMRNTEWQKLGGKNPFSTRLLKM